MEINLDLCLIEGNIEELMHLYFFKKISILYGQINKNIGNDIINSHLSHHYRCKEKIIFWQDRLEKEGRILETEIIDV